MGSPGRWQTSMWWHMKDMQSTHVFRAGSKSIISCIHLHGKRLDFPCT